MAYPVPGTWGIELLIPWSSITKSTLDRSGLTATLPNKMDVRRNMGYLLILRSAELSSEIQAALVDQLMVPLRASNPFREAWPTAVRGPGPRGGRAPPRREWSPLERMERILVEERAQERSRLRRGSDEVVVVEENSPPITGRKEERRESGYRTVEAACSRPGLGMTKDGFARRRPRTPTDSSTSSVPTNPPPPLVPHQCTCLPTVEQSSRIIGVSIMAIVAPGRQGGESRDLRMKRKRCKSRRARRLQLTISWRPFRRCRIMCCLKRERKSLILSWCLSRKRRLRVRMRRSILLVECRNSPFRSVEVG